MFYVRVRRSTGELCSASTIEGPKLLGRARKVEFGSNHGGLKQFSCTPDRTWDTCGWTIALLTIGGFTLWCRRNGDLSH